MIAHFDPRDGLNVLRAEISGPAGTAILRLALDTGATRSLLNAGILTALGYDPSLSKQRVEVTTGSGVEYAHVVPISQLICLGENRSDFVLLCHTLPPSAGVDGLLGLDFFRTRLLKIDFQNGTIELTA